MISTQDYGTALIGRGGKVVSPSYLYDRWEGGKDVDVLKGSVRSENLPVWNIVPPLRKARIQEIGFMADSERLSVLLSRARNALILIGKAETFMKNRKGEMTWKPFLNILSHEGQIYDDLPVQCEQHPDWKSVLRHMDDFDEQCPDGGCAAP